MHLSLNKQKILKFLLLFSLIWMITDGIFRKWVLPSLSSQLFAAKYVFFLLVYITYFLYTPSFIGKIKHGYQFLIFTFFLWCGFEFLFVNPFNAPILVRAMGMVNYLFFIPLLAVVPKYFNSVDKIEKMVSFLAIISVPIFFLGVIQYYLPTKHILNHLVNEDQNINRVVGFTRTLSIFTFVKIYDVYLLFVLSIFFSYLFYLIHQGKKILFIALLIPFGALNLVMTASRLPIFLSVVILSFSLLYIFTHIHNFRKAIISFVILSLFGGVLLYNFGNTFKQATDAFLFRAEQQEILAEKGLEGYSAKDRLVDRLDIYKFSKEAGWLGLGIGTTYQGTGFFLNKKKEELFFEEEGERVVLEIGIIGATILLFLRLFILFFSISFLFKIRHIKFALLTLPFVLYIIPQTFFLNNLTFNYLDGFSYWFSFALILSVRSIYTDFLEKEKRELENIIHT